MTLQLSYCLILMLAFTPGLSVGQTAAGSGSQEGGRQKQTQRVQTAPSNLQIDEFGFCSRILDKLHNRSRDAVQASAAKLIDIENVSQIQQQMRQQIESVEEHRLKLYSGLSPEQQNTVRVRVHLIDLLRDRIQEHLSAIEQLTASPRVDRHHLIVEARLNERAIRAYQVHFHEMGDELGMSGE